MLAWSSASYDAKYENRWCFYWVWLHILEKCNRHKKGFNQHEKSAVHCSAVNRFVQVPSSTDDIVGTVTKNLLEIQQKNLSALMKILSSIRYFARQRLSLRSLYLILNQIFVNYFYCGQKTILTFRKSFKKKQTDLFHRPFKMKF